jgi:hypothetical protein
MRRHSLTAQAVEAAVDTLLREAEDGPRATVSARHLHIYEDHIRRLTTENASLSAALEAHTDVAIIRPTTQQTEAGRRNSTPVVTLASVHRTA